MKKLNITGLLLVLMAMFTGCSEETITLTSELPQFETREGLMLLEVIVPYGTGINDQIYIYGDFNGGEEAVGNPEWLLQRGNPQSGVPAKFGIYINPSSFQNGKTLADGYTFYNIQNGPERSIENQPMLHYEYPPVGGRQNVFVDYWEEDFNTPENPDEVEHDGYALYILNNSSWTDLYLWAWEEGSGGEDFLGVGWPGLPFTGTQTINGVVYNYYDFGEMNNGKTVNVIVSNNGSPQSGTLSGLTLDKDYYFELSGTNLTEIDPETFKPGGGETPDDPEPDDPKPSAEYNIYIQNQTGWDNFYLYAWGDEEIFGGWPGQAPSSTITMGGVEYLVYTVTGSGETEHLIFNNNAGTQVEQADMVITLDQNWFINVTATEATFLDTPNLTIYADNQTGWSEIALYAWGDAGEVFGGWPGLASTTTETVNGVTYITYPAPANGKGLNLIFNNNNNGDQLGDFPITLNGDLYLEVTSEGVKLK